MVRVSEQLLFTTMANDKDVGAIAFINQDGEERIVKFQKGEKVSVTEEEKAVVLLGNNEVIDGEPARVESLEVVRSVMKKPIEEVIPCWSGVLLYSFEVMRLYRAASNGMLNIGKELKMWRITEKKRQTCVPILMMDLPPMREGLLNGINIGAIHCLM